MDGRRKGRRARRREELDHSRDIAAGSDGDVSDHVFESGPVRDEWVSSEQSAGLSAMVLERSHDWRDRFHTWREDVSERLEQFDLAPDLAQDIGSGRWFRGLGTMMGLAALSLAFWPDFSALEAMPAMQADQSVRDEFRSQTIAPLALGADTGRQSAPGSQVIPLAAAPERPQIQLVATLSTGDSFMRTLQRAGVSGTDAERVDALVSGAIDLAEVEAGTRMDITLGRRAQPGAPRPLDELSFRARFDLELELFRDDAGMLALKRNPIRVDDTPLRIRGTVGQSLYRSARAAGAPASAVQEYIKALDGQIDMERQIAASDEFDMIISYRRAATGERQAGQLLYAGIDRGGEPKTQLMRWGEEGRFYEASGVGEQRNGLVAPVPGSISSNFGMRRHPILGYRRMHAGMDFRARYGTPIVAVTDGRVTGAGRMGGCGIAVRLDHGNSLSTRYCHMSRLAVSRGQGVRRGQVIGYVGSTGLSTGAHLHYEMYRGGRAVNPASVRFVTRAQLEGRELMEFRARLRQLKDIEPGAALADLEKRSDEIDAPKREIEKLDQKREIS
ncbi:Peptidase family M23 [Altererythrobacter xiamenensis]|uniref:Peptidase family M23 n=2 Tax=Altererythrobacter xiamenensis TaxID=1316679 RepID=A0A1Y6F637_9SPHN|nr:Peptidase family M23 [Altererythrobacter xiamenensis]